MQEDMADVSDESKMDYETSKAKENNGVEHNVVEISNLVCCPETKPR
jgi:hypothetical protein